MRRARVQPFRAEKRLHAAPHPHRDRRLESHSSVVTIHQPWSPGSQKAIVLDFLGELIPGESAVRTRTVRSRGLEFLEKTRSTYDIVREIPPERRLVRKDQVRLVEGGLAQKVSQCLAFVVGGHQGVVENTAPTPIENRPLTEGLSPKDMTTIIDQVDEEDPPTGRKDVVDVQVFVVHLVERDVPDDPFTAQKRTQSTVKAGAVPTPAVKKKHDDCCTVCWRHSIRRDPRARKTRNDRPPAEKHPDTIGCNDGSQNS